jgi:hypothetical protein
LLRTGQVVTLHGHAGGALHHHERVLLPRHVWLVRTLVAWIDRHPVRPRGKPPGILAVGVLEEVAERADYPAALRVEEANHHVDIPHDTDMDFRTERGDDLVTRAAVPVVLGDQEPLTDSSHPDVRAVFG